ncbi:hypothetical protein NBCG_02379 [Nocardioidaceae bacterium Broad-1]|nr:hypothetical protein NBCG_02379 [Nocardioidaceae bacterium Broad-1]
MSVAPRVVLVHRATELEELVARHGTLGQVGFFLSSRGRDLAEVQGRHEALKAAISQVGAAIPLDWRQGSVERGDLDRFLFGPEDIGPPSWRSSSPGTAPWARSASSSPAGAATWPRCRAVTRH